MSVNKDTPIWIYCEKYNGDLISKSYNTPNEIEQKVLAKYVWTCTQISEYSAVYRVYGHRGKRAYK